MMRFRALKYATIFIAPVIGYLSLTYNGWWSWFLPLYVFAFIPFVELFTPASEQNLSSAEEEVVKKDRFYDWLLYVIVPVQYALLFYFFYILQQPGLSTLDYVGKTFSMGIACGVFGINVAHELGHRAKASEKIMAKLLLLTSLYMHFIIEHNRGHHKNVSTENDPASSRLNEPIYTFFVRSVVGSYFSAWHLEHDRLKRKGIALLSFNNEMIRFTVFQTLFVLGVYLLFGLKITLLFIIAAVVGFLLLETVNYIEHYGLQREKLGNGRWGKVLPAHSWNSNQALGRLMLFELTRHSDHHFKASRKYQVLRHFDDSPQMPYGYPAMMLLSFIPPVFFKIMNRQIDNYQLKVQEHKIAS